MTTVAQAQDRETNSPRFRFLRSGYSLIVLAALVLILFLWRPGVYQLRSRIGASIGSALGRKVALDTVSLHFLPRPGFDLEGLVIYDDPAFSAEPMIRAQEVSAAIRLRSLLAGHLEIATLSASEPSINLVRNDQGRWNLASLLERNAQIPVAPTQKTAFEHRPAFPYLEASSARINFKLGQTKKAYALVDADVALWQDSENSWGARLKAAPVRTDFNLTDTGVLRIDAIWQRAPSLRQTPLQVAVRWQKGQLGQITKLLTGKDRGWRGGIDLIANVTGVADALQIQSRATVDDFRRYDIVDTENLRLQGSCSGQYNVTTSVVSEMLCTSPVSDGSIRLAGTVALSAPAPTYDLSFEAEKIPLASMVRLLRQGKKQVPADLAATGSLSAAFHASRSMAANATRVTNGAQGLRTQYSGTGSAANVHLSSNGGADEINLGTIPLTLAAAVTSTGTSAREKPLSSKDFEPARAHVRIGPITVAMGDAAPASAGGWFSASGYRLFLRGDTELKNLFRLANMLGLPGTRPATEGSANVDIGISGLWRGFAPPVALGTAKVHNLRTEIHGLNAPLEIATAGISLDPDAVRLQKIAARTGNTHWSGSVTAARPCIAPNCIYQFDLTADRLSSADLVDLFTRQPTKRPWYRLIAPSDTRGPSPLLAVQASGTLQVGRFDLAKVSVSQVTSQVQVDQGKITLTSLRAQLLQGTHQGNWVVDVSTDETAPRPVRYRGTGTLQNISLAQVGTLMNDAWIAGTADGRFDLDGYGNSVRELLALSSGRLQFVMRNGSLPHIQIPDAAGPLSVHRFAGEIHLRKGVWEISSGRLDSRDGVYRVAGTASGSGGFDFLLTRADERSWKVTGSLAKPRVVPAEGAQANRPEMAPQHSRP